MSHRVRQASRPGPKLWLSGGNDRWQALVGVEVGQVLSFESCAIGAPTVSLVTEGNTEQLRQGNVAAPAPRSQRPCTCVHILDTRNRGSSRLYPLEMVTGGSVSEGEEPNDWRVRKREVGQTHRSLDVDEQR